MKRINFVGGTLITGDRVAAALMAYAAQLRAAVAVEIPALQENGSVAVHSLLIGPATQLEMYDVDGLPAGEEEQLFTVPRFPNSSRAVPTPSDRSHELAVEMNDEFWDEGGAQAH